MSYKFESLDDEYLNPHNANTNSHTVLFSSSPAAIKSPRSNSNSKISASWIETLEYLSNTSISTMNLSPAADLKYNLGISNFRYNNIFSNNASITTLVTTSQLKTNYLESRDSKILYFKSSLVPNTNNSITLGNSSRLYASVHANIINTNYLYSSSKNNIMMRDHLYPEVTTTYDLGSSANKFRYIYSLNIYSDNFRARYADLAENYKSLEPLEEGDVVTVSRVNGFDIEKTSEIAQSAILGTVSKDPGFLLNGDTNGEHYYSIGRIGKLKCKVIGKCKKGDVLISNLDGTSLVLDKYIKINPTSIVGVCNEDKDYIEEGIIEIIR